MHDGDQTANALLCGDLWTSGARNLAAWHMQMWLNCADFWIGNLIRARARKESDVGRWTGEDCKFKYIDQAQFSGMGRLPTQKSNEDIFYAATKKPDPQQASASRDADEMGQGKGIIMVET